MKTTKKFIGIVLATVLVLSCTFIPSTMVFAETLTAAETYAQNLGAVIGEEIFKETFSKSSMSASAEISGTAAIDSAYTDVAGWAYGNKGPVWAANAPKYKIANGRINYWCSYGEGFLVMPEIDSMNYILSAKFMRGGSTTAAAKAGIVTDMKTDYTSASVGLRFGVTFNAGTSPFPVANAITQPNSSSETASYYTLQNSYNFSNYVTLTIVSYNGVNYYFVEDEYVTSVDKRETDSERIGFYATTTDIYLDDVVVVELNEPAPAKTAEELLLEELGASVGDVLLNEPFEKGNMSAKILANGTAVELPAEYTTVPGWKVTNASDVLWGDLDAQTKIANGRVNLWTSYGDSALTLPDLNTSNYKLSVKVTRGGYAKEAGMIGILTDIDGDIADATTSKRFVLVYNGTENDGDYPVEKFSTQTGLYAYTEKVIEAPADKYNLKDYITITVISYNGTNYYFVNGDLITTETKKNLADERLSLFVKNADAYFDDVVVTKLEHNAEDEVEELFGKKVVDLGEVDDNETYKVAFNYVAASDVKVGFFTADADNANSVAYAETEYTVNGLNDNLKEAVTYVTVDKKGASKDAIGSNLYMYVIGEADVVIANATATKLANAKGGALVANGGVAMLKDVAENRSQALRYFFNYDTTTGKDIVIDGNTYKVVSRGFLLANGDALGEEQITRASANTMKVIDYNTTKLTNCWDVTANGDDTSSLCYSMYVKGFNPVNGTYNNTDRLYVKGYVEVEIDGNVYTFYGEEINVTVSEVAAHVG